MAKLDAMLQERMKRPAPSSKMAAMAEKSAAGELTTFSGMFNSAALSEREEEALRSLLHHYAEERSSRDLQSDFSTLSSLSAEVKAITQQAALLHGERIKKAHDLLANYREGAFTAWLIAFYGNRQTPYNFMAYYLFCEAMPGELRQRVEAMPRQAVYTLASREGPLDKKKEIVKRYQGETKGEMLALIRRVFPLEKNDERREKVATGLIAKMRGLIAGLDRLIKGQERATPLQKKELQALLKQLQKKVEAL